MVDILITTKPCVYTHIELICKVLYRLKLNKSVGYNTVVYIQSFVGFLYSYRVARIGREVGATVTKSTFTRWLIRVVYGDNRRHCQGIRKRARVGLVVNGMLEGRVYTYL